MRLAREIVVGLTRHPLRSFLLWLVYGLGLALVWVVAGAVEGGRVQIRSDLENLGVDVVAALNPMQIGPFRLGPASPGTPPLDAASIADLTATLAQDVQSVIPFRVELVGLKTEFGTGTTTLLATTPEFSQVIRSGLLVGRFLEPADFGASDPIPVVMDEALARKMAPAPTDMFEKELEIFRLGKLHGVRVVGVLRDPISLRRHLDAFDANRRARNLTARRLEFENIYLHYDSARDEPSGVLARARNVDDVEAVGERMEAFFEERGQAPTLFVQKLWIDAILDIVDRVSALTRFLSLMTLVVVLILVATISLLAIEERYYEIAIRRVEGATVLRVVLPFLLEGGVLALLSVPAGTLLADFLLETVVRPVLLWEPVVPLRTWLGVPPLVFLVGVGAHAIASRRVARMAPVEVLGDFEG